MRMMFRQQGTFACVCVCVCLHESLLALEIRFVIHLLRNGCTLCIDSMYRYNKYECTLYLKKPDPCGILKYFQQIWTDINKF